MNKDYYKILGVDKGANKEDIKKAYRELSKQHHPDRGGDEEKFKEINEAHSVLSDPEKRAEYDNPMRQMGDFPFGNIFGGQGGFRPPFRKLNPNAPRRGRPVDLEHDASMHMFILGGDLKVSFGFKDACEECNGAGATEFDECNLCGGTGRGRVISVRSGLGVHVQSSGPCMACNGRGRKPKNKCETCAGTGAVKIDKKITLPIPPGFRDGQLIGAAGQGGRGINGGPPGDLLVRLHMKYPDPDELTDEQKKILEEL